MKQQRRHNGTFWATAENRMTTHFFAQQSLKYIDIGLPTLHEFWTIKILEFQLEFHEMNNIAALFKTIPYDYF